MTNSDSGAWRQFLIDDFSERRTCNQNFSLRSYARVLSVSPSHLSLILSGQRPVTAKTALHLANKLGVTPSETIQWLKTGLSTTTKGSNHELSESEFNPISEWYYYAILGLANLKVNSAEVGWIAQRLNLPVQLVSQALRDLISAKYIVIRNGQFRKATHGLRTQSDVPSQTKRRFHRQILKIADEKIESVPIDRREFIHMTLAIDPKRLKAAKKMMREFVETFTAEVTQGNRSSVYHFNTQFYPVSESR